MRGEIFSKVMIFTIGAFLIGTQLVNLVNFLNGGNPTMNIYEMGLWWTVFLIGAFLIQNPMGMSNNCNCDCCDDGMKPVRMTVSKPKSRTAARRRR